MFDIKIKKYKIAADPTRQEQLMTALAKVNRGIVSIPEAADPTEVHAWAKQVGPLLLRLVKHRDLTPKEGRLLRAIKEICPCHWTDHPKEEFSPNEETCEICGRPM